MTSGGPPPPAAPLLQLRDVGFAYARAGEGPARPFAMTGLDVSVARGEILGVIGPNSAGKTTLVRLVTRVLAARTGDILLNGRPLADLGPWELARAVAVVQQEIPAALRFTVEQLALMGRYPHAPARYFESGEDLAIAREAMAATGVLELASMSVDLLSGGERQRAILARALAQAPELLVLDEPTSHLDLRHQVECAALLERLNRARGTSILLISHDLNLAAQLSDRLLLLSGGRIARLGRPAEVLDEELLRSVYGCDVIVGLDGAGRRHVRVAWPARVGAEGEPARGAAGSEGELARSAAGERGREGR